VIAKSTRNPTLDTELRVVRLLTIVAGLVAAATIVGGVTVVVQPTVSPMPAWFAVAIVVLTALPLVVAILAPFVRMAFLRRANAVAVITHLLLLATFWPAVSLAFDSTPSGQLPWMLTVSAFSVAGAVLAWGQLGGWVALGVFSGLVFVLRVLLDDLTPNAIVNDVSVLIISMVLCLLCGALLVTSRQVDSAATTAATTVASHAAAHARRAALARTRALVHDEILATLLVAAHGGAEFGPAVALQARRARRHIRELGEPGGSAAAMTVDDLASAVLLVADEIDEHAEFRMSAPAAARDARVPPEASEAILGAVRQALVNSVTHAGPSARRVVTFDLTPAAPTPPAAGPASTSGRSSSHPDVCGGVRVVVRDDGVGFDPDTVPASRMGLATSIRDRLAAVPGGSAGVESSPGLGTVVTVEWAVPATDRSFGADSPELERALRSEQLTHVRGVRAAVAVFLVSQLVLAVTTAIDSPTPLLSLTSFAGIALGLLTLGWAELDRPSIGRSLLCAAFLITTSAVILLPGVRLSLSYEDAWYLTGCAFVFLTMVLRGRAIIALGGLALLTTITVTGVFLHQFATTEMAASITRPIVVVAIAAGFAVAIGGLGRRIRAFRAYALRVAQEEAYEATSRRELRERSGDLDRLIGPMLARLELLGEPGAVFTAADAQECAALEGLLRDHHRGERMLREPLLSAAMTARRRAVDVVLLDDGDAELPEDDLDAIAQWLTSGLEQVVSGPFIGRILPVGRAGLASMVSDSTIRYLDPATASGSV